MRFVNVWADAMIRYLKAKLRVMQEEVEQLNKANRELVSVEVFDGVVFVV